MNDKPMDKMQPVRDARDGLNKTRAAAHREELLREAEQLEVVQGPLREAERKKNQDARLKRRGPSSIQGIVDAIANGSSIASIGGAVPGSTAGTVDSGSAIEPSAVSPKPAVVATTAENDVAGEVVPDHAADKDDAGPHGEPPAAPPKPAGAAFVLPK